jgi:isopentenyl diphosphate isomerase/L-lactate dehydrogenase-like FMN-dependent dehydrogenase
VLLFGNIGSAQLTKDAVPDIAYALDRVGANAVAVHTNPLQEAIRHNGDTDFAGSLDRLHELVGMLVTRAAEGSRPRDRSQGATRRLKPDGVAR